MLCAVCSPSRNQTHDFDWARRGISAGPLLAEVPCVGAGLDHRPGRVLPAECYPDSLLQKKKRYRRASVAPDCADEKSGVEKKAGEVTHFRESEGRPFRDFAFPLPPESPPGF